MCVGTSVSVRPASLSTRTPCSSSHPRHPVWLLLIDYRRPAPAPPSGRLGSAHRHRFKGGVLGRALFRATTKKEPPHLISRSFGYHGTVLSMSVDVGAILLPVGSDTDPHSQKKAVVFAGCFVALCILPKTCGHHKLRSSFTHQGAEGKGIQPEYSDLPSELHLGTN